MSSRRLIVLDKDFFVSVSTKDFRELSKDYEFVVTESLIGECMQYLPDGSDPEKQRRAIAALRKFSDESVAQSRIDGTGPLISIEVDTRIPCWPVSDYISRGVWFNPSYLSKERQLDLKHLDSLGMWKTYYQEQFGQECLTSEFFLSPIFNWYPKLKEVRRKNDLSVLKKALIGIIPEIRTSISNDTEFVRAHYDWCRPLLYPPAKKIDARWMLYRSIQANLLQHLESIEVRSDGRILKEEIVTHDLRDYSYCMIAAQVGAIATNEKKQHMRFMQMCPDGIILSKNPNTKKIEVMESGEIRHV